ncbi:hypothetical protein H9657_18205 [Cellulomonas sp. Sa3CUA2]|uniref:LGFP repeat-containing protein n=1 Tax=Cellulomonas avistercoris TaxID=2762242 RepID=A0ABR8QIF2_9CELL|nr:hypothetical protein [Cellulomonas avistercoris]MBD7920209.1 hypothetical protein [Cellulomonas avistercoris]
MIPHAARRPADTVRAAPRRRPAVLAAVTTVLAMTLGTLVAAPAQAADPRYFDPGNIIADEVFFDGGAMDVAAVSAFIADKGRSCRAGNDGTPCLKDYRESTWTRSQSGCASTYEGAANETAAQIIVKVARACGVNPRALLVLLQKEQSLVTASGSSLYATRYRSATGYGCPDTAPCASQYYGFFNQVYLAARQFRLYAANPTSYAHRPGTTNTVRFHPNAACGSSSVLIRNSATAGLYNYTPYQPNGAVLGGSPDGCSSYGNLNFWSTYTDWFGSTQSRFTVTGAVLELWASLGYSASPIGEPVGNLVTGLKDGGSFQPFRNGAVYSSPATGTHYVTAAYDVAWPTSRRENGPLGYPLTDPRPLRAGGSYQVFQGGAIYSSPVGGTRAVLPAVDAAWPPATRENGPLGYPTTDLLSTRDNASFQWFEGGGIYLSAHGTFAVPRAVDTAWAAGGRENGPLGLPTSAATRTSSGETRQSFERGLVVVLANGTAFTTTTSIAARWDAAGGATGSLGKPLSGSVALRGGAYQSFERGSVYSSTAGTFVVTPTVDAAWPPSSRENGPLGYPTSDAVTAPDGRTTQTFQGGIVTSAAGGPVLAVAAPVHAPWAATGGLTGSFGPPSSPFITGLRNGGGYQVFARGGVWSSPSTGAHAVSPAFDAAWPTSQRENGPLGYPTSRVFPLRDGGSFQAFQGGGIWSSPAGAYAVSAAFDAAWPSSQRENGPLGFPTSAAVRDGSGMTVQTFQGGRVVQAPGRAPVALTKAVWDAWQAAGGVAGLGVPTSEARGGLRNGGSFQTFERGGVWTSGAGSFAVTAAFDAAWPSSQRENGPLGYPTSAARTDASGRTVQTFERGRLVQASPGAQVVATLG